MTQITHDSLLAAGFQPCIFAPIYFCKCSYYLGNLDWSKGEETRRIKPKYFWQKSKVEKVTVCNNLKWEDAKMIIAVSADGESYIEWWSRKQFSSIEEIKEYCTTHSIEMKSSPSPLNKQAA